MPVSSKNKRVEKVSKPQPKRKSIACSPCHARKIRCLGGSPCVNCTDASLCVYPHRDPQVKVNQSYIDRLLEENANLRALGSTSPSHSTPAQGQQLTPESAATAESLNDNHPQDQEGVAVTQNPMLQPEPWFTLAKTSNAPVWIGEASDSAFATRLRQFAAPDPQTEDHTPRTHYATDEMLASLTSSSSSSQNITWPYPSRARFLIEVALRHICRCYHIVRRSEVMASIEVFGKGSGFASTGRQRAAECRLWALLAHGELHSTKMATSENTFPGLVYYAKASELVQLTSERPQLEDVETMLLLSLYSLHTNRRHAAYTLVGSAIRLATVMGLHLNIAHKHIPDPAVREHRKRLWWTAYNFDRFWSCKLGLPVSIPEGDISVGLPEEMNGARRHEDFAAISTDHLVANVSLARLAGDIIRVIYGREQRQLGSFSQRVQGALKSLRTWSEELPVSLQLHPADNTGRPVSLHLAFNQLLILATRPVMLHVLCRHLAASRGDAAAETEVPTPVKAVADACAHAARHSCMLLTECWIQGSFHAYDFFYTQYLFSASTILAISAILSRRGHDELHHDDLGRFNSAVDFLDQLQRHGNFAAREFHTQVQSIISSVLEPLGMITKQLGGHDLATNDADTAPSLSLPIFDPAVSVTTDEQVFRTFLLQDFLTEENLDLSFLDNMIMDDGNQGLYWQ